MKNLLVPVDFSEVTERVVDAAEQLAVAFGAKVWLLHCVIESKTGDGGSEDQIIGPISDKQLAERFPKEYRQLKELVEHLLDEKIDTETIFVSGVPVEEILAAADRHSADLIIVGSHGHGVLFELLVGTVAKFVLLRSGRPTLIIPSRTHKTRQSLKVQKKRKVKVGNLEFTKPEFFGLHD